MLTQQFTVGLFLFDEISEGNDSSCNLCKVHFVCLFGFERFQELKKVFDDYKNNQRIGSYYDRTCHTY